MASPLRSFFAASVFLAGALAACSLFDPIVGLTGGDASVDDPPDATYADAGGDVLEDGGADANPCTAIPHADDASVRDGFLCGVGACRKRLVGASCTVVTLPDGGKESPCRAAFPAEIPGDGVDNDCDGLVDEGFASASPEAGIDCRGCAFGHLVQRLADGTFETMGGVDNRTAHVNSTACINSDRCKIGAAAWMRNVSMMTCTSYCKAIGGACKNACATASGQCKSQAIGVNFGTYASDYQCAVPPGHPNGEAGTPLVGDCDKTFPGVIDPSADFNLACCCEL